MKKVLVAVAILIVIATVVLWAVYTPKAQALVCSGFHVRSYYTEQPDCDHTVNYAWVKIKCTAHNPPHESDWLLSGPDGFVCTSDHYHYCPICLVNYSDLHTGYWYVLSNTYDQNKSSGWLGPYYLDLGHTSVGVDAWVRFVIGK